MSMTGLFTVLTMVLAEGEPAGDNPLGLMEVTFDVELVNPQTGERIRLQGTYTARVVAIT